MPPERSNRRRRSQSQSSDGTYSSRSRNIPSGLSVTTRLSWQRSGTQEDPMIIAEESLSQTLRNVPAGFAQGGPQAALDDEDPAAVIFLKEPTSVPTSGSANCKLLIFLPGEYERLHTSWERRQDFYKATEARAEELKARVEELEARVDGLRDHMRGMRGKLWDLEFEVSNYKVKDAVRERNWRDVWDMYERSVNTFRDAMTCPMCFEKTADRATVCGHQFCGGCITIWAASNDSCPACRAALDKTRDPTGTSKLHNLSSLRDKGKGIEEGFERLIPHKPFNDAES